MEISRINNLLSSQLPIRLNRGNFSLTFTRRVLRHHHSCICNSMLLVTAVHLCKLQTVLSTLCYRTNQWVVLQKGEKKKEREKKFSLYAAWMFRKPSKSGFLDSGMNMGVAERVSLTEDVLLVWRENSSVSIGKIVGAKIQGKKITRQAYWNQLFISHLFPFIRLRANCAMGADHCFCIWTGTSTGAYGVLWIYKLTSITA